MGSQKAALRNILKVSLGFRHDYSPVWTLRLLYDNFSMLARIKH